MIASLPYISEHQRKIVEAKLADILAKTHPEIIVCYGMRTNILRMWSSFSSESEKASITTIDLLIVTSEKDKRTRESIANIIDNLCNEEIHIITVVHSVDAVNSGLRESNLFFVTLYHNGILLYDRAEIQLEIPNDKVKTWIPDTNRLAIAQSFYETACDCATTERYETAMFLFHQSVELSCAELLKSRLGYRSTTHSLRKLLALSENITTEIKDIFPASTDQESELFELLHRAYIDVRYKDDYSVSPDDVFILMERISSLHNRVEELCRETHIIQFNESAKKEHADSLPKFQSIVIATTADIILHKGEREDVMIETSDNRESIFAYVVEDNRLWLSIRNDTGKVIPYAIIQVTYTALNGLVVDESGSITCNDTIESEFLGIIQNGKGNIDLNINVSSLDATITKSGSLRLSGTADRAKVLNTGPGEFNGTDLEVSEAQVTIKDSGNISIAVEDELIANLHGDGILRLKGEPRLKSLSMNKELRRP